MFVAGFADAGKSHRVKKNSAKEKAKRAKKCTTAQHETAPSYVWCCSVVQDGTNKNPKAFGVYSGVKAARAQKRTLDRAQRKDHVPIVSSHTDIHEGRCL